MHDNLIKIGRYWITRPDVCCETCDDTGTVFEDADPDNEVKCPDCNGRPEDNWRENIEGSIENEAYDRWKDER